MSELKPPDDSLNSYFDELLGLGENHDSQIQLPLAVGNHFPASRVTNVVNLPSRGKNSSVTREQPPAVMLETPRRLKEPPQYAEPESDSQEEEKKQKLEKLLQTAHQQFLKQDQHTEPEVLVQTKTFIQAPDEIQDWPIETTESQVETAVEEVPVQKMAEVTPAQESFDHELALEDKSYQVPNLEWAANGLPQWAQSRFDVLLFDVAGLTLAVPLISLGQIYPLTDELTPLFGQAEWFMGIQPTPMGKIHTVNTARFVMPEKYNDALLANAKYVMSLNGVSWGLALDSVAQPMRLNPDQVKWRSDRSKRPWLAGTVKEHMCALLDVPRIAQLLLDLDKNHQRR